MTDTVTTPSATPDAPSEAPAPVVPTETARAKFERLLNEARLILAQDPTSPLMLPVLSWDTQLMASLDKAEEVAEQLKPKGGPSAAEVKKLIAESTDDEVIKRREALKKLEEQRKALLSQMTALVGAGVPELEKEEKDALKEVYKAERDILAKSCPALESMMEAQNSAQGVELIAALKAAIPNLTGGSSGAGTGTGTSKTRFATIEAILPNGDAENYSTFSALAAKTAVKEDVSALYELFHGAGGNTETAASFNLSNGWYITATPKAAA